MTIARIRQLPANVVAKIAAGEVVAASEYCPLQNQVRELQRLLGQKTMEAEILKDAL